MLVLETNRYAQQKLNESKVTDVCSRMHKWISINFDEIKKFLGLILWMGFVKINPIANYWSKSPLYNFQLASVIISRNKFELLLSNFHFINNMSITCNDRLRKILPFFDKLQKKYQKIFILEKYIVIDEMLISWRERVIFKHIYQIKYTNMESNYLNYVKNIVKNIHGKIFSGQIC